MFEKFSPEENNDIQSKIDVHEAQSEMVRERLSDPDLSESQRKALREILINNGIKVSMYKQFNDSISVSHNNEAKVIEIKAPEEEDDSNQFKKAV